jgi:hypothetical protein
MNYKDFYKSLYNEQQAHQALDEEKFKRRKNLTHVADVPQLSNLWSDQFKVVIHRITCSW